MPQIFFIRGFPKLRANTRHPTLDCADWSSSSPSDDDDEEDDEDDMRRCDLETVGAFDAFGKGVLAAAETKNGAEESATTGAESLFLPCLCIAFLRDAVLDDPLLPVDPGLFHCT